MIQIFHILNGDALKDQFPKDIKGECMVARECMVDSDVSGDTPVAIFLSRAQFMSDNYPDVTPEIYEAKTVHEFDKMGRIPNEAEINLWFEDDLFCQVNLWFVLFYMVYNNVKANYYLVRPTTELQFGFGGMGQDALKEALKNRMLISENHVHKFVKLWKHYQDDDLNSMEQIALELTHEFPFLEPAVEAHIQRKPNGEYPGKPKQTLLKIIEELQTKDFGTIFRAFNQRESIYGFGDLQVKRMLDELIKQH